MTAQIAMMNKNAVALATDSAVTTSNSRGVKVHNSANKLFTLSKYEAVGVMVHANADFMGYPWETLIKAYRHELGTKSFANLARYADDFFNFLITREHLLDEERQNTWFRSEVDGFTQSLNREFLSRVRKLFDESGQQLDEFTLLQLLDRFVSETESIYGVQPDLPLYERPEDSSTFTNAASSIVEDAIEQSFQDLPIAAFRPRLQSIVVKRFTTDSGVGFSGLVFAGFGQEEFLPVVQSFWIDGIFAGKVRRMRFESLSGDMNDGAPVSIYPFAQSDSVRRFLQGVDPAYKTEAEQYLGLMTAEITHFVNHSAAVLSLEDAPRQALQTGLAEAVADGKARLAERLSGMEFSRFLSPVMEVVASLPKEDLAAIAESLVNLTSFQRKILQETETVGGPIDVAVISKGDGFIWIKRKHYFDKELNPAFFANYYRGVENAN